MSGWRNWNKSSDRADLGPSSGFLSAGTEPYNPYEGSGNSDLTKCSDSNQCASGWVCSGGFCVDNNGTPANGSTEAVVTSPGFQSAYPGYIPPNGTPGVPNSGPNSNVPIGARYPRGTGSGRGSGSLSGCGEDNITDPNSNKRTKSRCEPDPPDNGCRKSGCGPDPGKAHDCCGEERCCRYSANGFGVTTRCFCGPCPPKDDQCNSFCSSFKSATGDLMPGCDPSSVCDECSDCIGGFSGTMCSAKVEGTAPCQCEGSGCGLSCENCDPDGVCRLDCERCTVPYPTYARCSCGYFESIAYVNVCGERKTISVDCESLCRNEDDPCAGSCSTVTWCEGAEPPCPPRSTCTNNGFVSAGGRTCYFKTVCNKSSVPPECEECDCNCDDDCRDCEICGSSGICIDDPECGEQDLVWESPSEFPGYPGNTLNSVGSAPKITRGPYNVFENSTVPNQIVAYFDYSTTRCNGVISTGSSIRYAVKPNVPTYGGWYIKYRGGRCPP